MKIKILKSFMNPLTGRKTKKDEVLNVPASQFWFKRLRDKDCEKIEIKPKTTVKVKEDAPVVEPQTKAKVKTKKRGKE